MRPPFQRRLVWTNAVKDKFLETVLKGLPFPEIFIATGEIDTNAIHRVNELVDGQQRISTLHEYAKGSKDLVLKKVKPYAALSQDEKKKFLDYIVSVRDLGTVSGEEIKEIFSRINSTDFPLKRMEKLNALYNGEYINFCDNLSMNHFFESHRIFSLADRKRMNDVTFCVILITTIKSTYYHRDELNEEYLNRFNDDFSGKAAIDAQMARVFDFIDHCGFDEKSRAWKKTDLFTLLVEIHHALIVEKLQLTPAAVGTKLKSFFKSVEKVYDTKSEDNKQAFAALDNDARSYHKAATKATNDKYSRVIRGEIIGKIIKSTSSSRTKNKKA